MEEQNNTEIIVDIIPSVNYALVQNGMRIIKRLAVRTGKDNMLSDADLVIRSEPEMLMSCSIHIEQIPSDTEFELKNPVVRPDPQFFVGLTERVSGTVIFELTSKGEMLAEQRMEITALAYDEWHGEGIYPELLASFVMPNQPQLTPLIAKAATFLEEWTGDPSFDAYQSGDNNRVLKQAAAIYSALASEKIVYSVPPASFEKTGQRIRLCDAVIGSKLGTCMDLSLLYASLLEAIGLNPLLLLKEGHIFAGVWLEDKNFSETVQDDPSLVAKRLADGINEIAIVECTALTAGRNMTFDDACASAEKALPDVYLILDIARARVTGIKPLPQRVMSDEGWKIERSEINSEVFSAAPKERKFAGSVTAEETPATRKQQWERKLLDLGLRNSLINFRISKTTVPLLSGSVDDLEDALADGEDFQVLPKPADLEIPTEDIFENLHSLENHELILSEFKNHRLRSVMSETELYKTLKELYRAAKTSLEENGANTLYIAMGLLRWYENPRSKKARYAPLLLIPIEMVRKSAAHGYVIRLRDEDTQMNVTILEKLKQDFGITVTGLDPLPLDDHGTDTRKVFTIIRQAVMSQKNWDVLESAYLGIFSFSQFVMWNDLRNRADDLAQNKVVRSLMDGKLCWEAKEMLPGEGVEQKDILLPLPADASQLYAIGEANDGESFVLHGPPGTGKSQTITALIANALAHNKTVLFVAEKMAALEVVERRLDDIGIGDFCLELHSNKSRKKDVLEQLRRASDVTKYQSGEDYQKTAEAISKQRQELDEYKTALHQKQPCGKSVYELISSYEKNIDAPEIGLFPTEILEGMTPEMLQQQTIDVQRLSAAAKGTGHPHQHPLSRVKEQSYSQRIRSELSGMVSGYESALKKLQDALQPFTAAASLENRLQDAAKAADIAKEMQVWFALPSDWAAAENIDTLTHDIHQMCEHYIKANEQRAEMEADWKEDFFIINGADLLARYRETDAKWFISKAIGMNQLVKTVSAYSKKGIDKNGLEPALTALASYQDEQAKAKEFFGMYRTQLGELYNGAHTYWKTIIPLCTGARNSAHKLKELTGSDDFRRKVCIQADMKEPSQELVQAYSEYTAAKEQLYALLKLDGTDVSFEDEQKLCRDLTENADGIKEWITYNMFAGKAREDGLEAVVNAYEDGLSHESAESAYQKAICKALAESAIEKSDILNHFSGTMFNEKITRFRQLDQELTELAKKEIYCRLAAKVPNFSKEASQNSELGIIQKAIRSGGRGLSIRKLFEQIPEILPRLCPCMLMSPLSAAQYLDPKRKPFDIVVFDEASQLQTCKAVGALARGSSAVIVGDPKQMPPTSFFAVNTVDEDNIDTEDLESILDDCLALNMSQTHLLWHYRSRHESLIAFSNRQFYENKLYTFPSVNDREQKVRLIHVDGTFDRGKTRQNRAEAEAIVAELKRRAHDKKLSKYSVGVVTFNITQQNLIDDLLTEQCKTDNVLEMWAYHSKVPLFIKNLENVQGDERDVILFSVGYGPDKDGRVSMNFGPLNRDGGWRRLNVAVSRAKYEMVVYSTLDPDMINLSRTSAEGVAALKAFLQYAAGKENAVSSISAAQNDAGQNGIADIICRTLAEKGYDTQRSVGHSEYRIDIGVVDPKNPEKYLLGILLDGISYASAGTTRDREIAQTGVLNGLGWELIRIWSMDWWDNSRKEMNRILEKLEELKNRPEELEEEPEEEQIDENEIENTEGTTFASAVDDFSADLNVPTYHAVQLAEETVTAEQLMQPDYEAAIREKVQQLVDGEAPITTLLLLRKLAKSFGITRITPKLQEYLEAQLKEMKLRKLNQSKGVAIYWNASQSPNSYYAFRADGTGDNHRDVKDVPLYEAANAVVSVLYDQVGLPRADLVKEAAKRMNYVRMGANISSVFDTAVTFTVNMGMAEEDEHQTLRLTDRGKEAAEQMNQG